MKNKITKSANSKPDTVISLQQKNRTLQIQIDKAQRKIFTLENKLLKLENKSLKQEQKIIKLEIEIKQLKEPKTGGFVDLSRWGNTGHNEPPNK